MVTTGTAGRVIRLDVPRLAPTLNTTIRMSWADRMRLRREWAWELRAALGRQPRPAEPFQRALVVIERYALQTPDRDGLIGGCKALIDCLLAPSKRHPTGLGLVQDDKPEVMQLEVHAIRVPHRAEQRTVITITELLAI